MFALEKIRIQKILSELGIASRRKAEEMLSAGRITVNGETASVGCKADPLKDNILIDGRPVPRGAKHEKIYVMLYKPRGYITTMHDQLGRKCTADLVKGLGRVFPVGRLDRGSEGLLLLTNDGEFANSVMHPANHIPKTYRVTVRPAATGAQINEMAAGIEIDGRKTAPAEVAPVKTEDGKEVLEITLHEGRNREIRKMCEKLGLEVARLKRISIGELRLGGLAPGKWRRLTEAEAAGLTGRKAR